MIYLLIALAALVLGPAVLGRLRGRPALAAGLDSLVLVSITGLVFLHFVPDAVEERHVAVLVGLVVGFLLPVVMERLTRDVRHETDRWGLLLGLTGLAIHAGLDGAALATVADSGTDSSLAIAVILHRLPVGIAVWWLATTLVGRWSGAAALVALMVATVIGYYGGTEVTRLVGSSELIELYQAVVGGSLVHVVMHPSHPLRAGSRSWAEGVGALLAFGLLLVVMLLPEAGHSHGPDHFFDRLFVLAAEVAPALLLAYFIAGLLSAYVPSASIRWLGKGGAFSQAGRGMAIGLPFPICSCGVVPLYRTLVARGAPPAAAMAFLVATPELGLDAILLSIPLLGTELTVVRLVTAAAAALLVGWWVGGRLQASTATSEEQQDDRVGTGLVTRLRSALVSGTGEIVDHTAPWILLGLVAAALVAPWLEGGWLAQLPSPVAIILFAALGFPTYVCASSATPLVAAFLAGGLTPGAGIAFLITGPATNISTLGVLSSLHGKRAAVAFATVLVVFAVATGMIIDLVFTQLVVPTLPDISEETPSTLQLVCLAGLVVLFGASIARRGIRRFVGELGESFDMKHEAGHHEH